MQVKTPASAAALYLLIWVKTIAQAPDFFPAVFAPSQANPTT
jgi:hypothetical protein